MIKKFPTLYKLSPSGKLMVWNLEVDEARIEIEYGQYKGKMQRIVQVITELDDTKISSDVQALNKAENMWNDKKNEGFDENNGNQ